MRTAILSATLSAALLGGCATPSEKLQAQVEVDKANAAAKQAVADTERRRLELLGTMASGTAGDTARVAAIMAIVQGQANRPAPAPQMVQTREGGFLDWVRLLLGVGLNAYGIHTNKQIAVTQSNNNRDIILGGYEAVTDVAGHIQAPQANVTTNTTTTTTTNTTLSGTGVIGDGQFSTVDSHDITTSTDSHDVITDSTHPPTVVVQPPPVVVTP